MSYDQLKSDLSTYVKKRSQQPDDSFDPLARHMDDVVDTGPEGHLVSDFEHMVLRNEGDTVNFWGLEITKTSRGFEVKEQYRLRGIFFEPSRV